MPDDKTYSAEVRLNQLWSHLGPIAAGGGNGQRLTGIATGMPQSIVTAVGSYLTVASMAVPVTLPPGAGSVTYRFDGVVVCTQGGASTNQQNFRFTGPSTTAGRWNTLSFVTGGAVQISSSIAPGNANVTAAYSAGSTWMTLIYGWFTFTANGTLQFQAGEGGAGGPFTVVDGILNAETTGATT